MITYVLLMIYLLRTSCCGGGQQLPNMYRYIVVHFVKCRDDPFIIMLRRCYIIYTDRWDALQQSNRTRKKYFAKLLKTNDTDFGPLRRDVRPRPKTGQTENLNFFKERRTETYANYRSAAQNKNRLTVFEWTHADVWTCVYRVGCGDAVSVRDHFLFPLAVAAP